MPQVSRRFSSPLARRNSPKKLPGLSGRIRLALTVALFGLLVCALFSLGALAEQSSVDAGEAFDAKADKLLQRVHRIAIERRSGGRQTAEGGPSGPQVRLPEAELEAELADLSKLVAVERTSEGALKVNVTVRLTEKSDAELRAAGFAVGARIGDVATVQTEAERLPELASLSTVSRLSAAVYRQPSNDRARRAVGVDNTSGQRVVSQTGRGVVVGIIDTGIDFRHGDFLIPGTNRTRIKALWDISDTRDDYTLPGGTAARGHFYSEADINAALADPSNPNIVKEKDLNGHGTHVAGTAAGNGNGGTSPSTYAGMAPEADLVIVKAMRSSTADGGFATSDTINALKFIQQQAAALNEPFVINMSLGGQLGPHDGTGDDERTVDTIVNGGAGRVVCIAAGNEGDANIHATTTVPAGGSLTLNFNLTGQSDEYIDLYQANADRFTVTVIAPNGTTLGPLAYKANGFGTPAENSYLTLYNANDNKGDGDPANDQPDIFLIFKDGAPTGDWQIKLQDADSNPNQPFDAWAEGDITFTNFVDNNSHLIGSPGTSKGAVTVGAFITRTASLTVGNYAPFTSPGPTADGRQKPEVSAPGYYLYSTRSADSQAAYTYGTGSNATVDSTHYGGFAGTSMATPVVTGSVALLLQANRNLTVNQVKDLLKNTANHDSFDPAGYNSRFGFGKLNVAAALATLAPAAPTLQLTQTAFTAGEAAGRIDVSVTRSGDTSTAVSVDYLTSDTAGFNACSNANGIASARCDYAESRGTLRFAAGETNKVISIPLVDDMLVEGNENFTVTLTNAVGATLGTGSATLTITDNDTSLSFNPIDTTPFFVRQHYIDFLGREPDPAGYQGWQNTLNNCAPNDTRCDRIEVSSAFFRSAEFQERGYFVYRFYSAAFGRFPHYAEFMPDIARVSGFLTPAEQEANKVAFVGEFMARPEFTNRYNSLTTPTAYVDGLLQASGLPNHPSRAGWISALQAGTMTRGQVLRALAESAELYQKFYNESFVVMQYFGYLRRDPDALYQNWIQTLNSTGDYRLMVNGFMNSVEYRQRFGP